MTSSWAELSTHARPRVLTLDQAPSLCRGNRELTVGGVGPTRRALRREAPMQPPNGCCRCFSLCCLSRDGTDDMLGSWGN